MIERIVNKRNLMHACRQVCQNKGSAGVDGMAVCELSKYLSENRERIVREVTEGSYQAKAIKGVEIPKGNGGKRLLGVPTVGERLLQQAVAQVISLKFEPGFKQHSYGFRPKRNAQQAVLQAQRNINEGYRHIVDTDLRNFFDEVDHCLLLQLVYRKVKCRYTMRLVRKWLKAPILINGKLVKRSKGMPQGSPLSPLLSNILLHELDCELERQGLKYVRYADDFSIYCKSRQTASKVGNDIFVFLRDKLKLAVNREKSGIRKPVQFEVLGYRFVPTYHKGDRGKYQLTVSAKGWKRLKTAIKQITRKTAPLSFPERVRKLKEIQRGWINYFRMASISAKLKDIDSWARNRLRYCIWTDWKKPERKRKNLIRLGVDQDHAYAWSRSRMGGWAVAQLSEAISRIPFERQYDHE